MQPHPIHQLKSMQILFAFFLLTGVITNNTRQGTAINGSSEKGMLGDTWAWDGKEWKQLATAGPSPGAMGYMAYDKARDRTVLFGGRPGWPNNAHDTWEWDGKEWKEIK